MTSNIEITKIKIVNLDFVSAWHLLCVKGHYEERPQDEAQYLQVIHLVSISDPEHVTVPHMSQCKRMHINSSTCMTHQLQKKGQMIYTPISPKNTRGWLPSMGKDAGHQSLGKCK